MTIRDRSDAAVPAVEALQTVRTMLCKGLDLAAAVELTAHPRSDYARWSPLWDRLYDAQPSPQGTLRAFAARHSLEEQFAVVDLALAVAKEGR